LQDCIGVVSSLSSASFSGFIMIVPSLFNEIVFQAKLYDVLLGKHIS